MLYDLKLYFTMPSCKALQKHFKIPYRLGKNEIKVYLIYTSSNRSSNHLNPLISSFRYLITNIFYAELRIMNKEFRIKNY